MYEIFHRPVWYLSLSLPFLVQRRLSPSMNVDPLLSLLDVLVSH